MHQSREKSLQPLMALPEGFIRDMVIRAVEECPAGKSRLETDIKRLFPCLSFEFLKFMKSDHVHFLV
ncbi:hypothetical protein AXW95_24300 [Pseudomonas aeruginosa]|nr:hypothetical protein AXW95_24300 [Pseudomonas aeruginosa]